MKLSSMSRNPCSSGYSFRRGLNSNSKVLPIKRRNPCSSGYSFRSMHTYNGRDIDGIVAILVLVDIPFGAVMYNSLLNRVVSMSQSLF